MLLKASAPPLDFARLLSPRSVVIIGASDKPGSLGAAVLTNLESAGFAGQIHLINPKRAEIGSRPCLASVDALPYGIDVAVLAIPRGGVLEAVRGLAARGCGAAVVFSSGFAEDGPEGLVEQQELASIAHEAGMIVEGPNCLGLVNFRDHVPLTFIELPQARAHGSRRVGVISQSGAMAAVLATTMIAREVPLSCYISTGNEAANGVEDFLGTVLDDPETVAIGMVVEHFRQPARFLASARAARDAGKHIVLLHPGSSAAGAASAATHTGALAGDHAVMRVHCHHAGVILVDTLEELGDVVEILARATGPLQGGVGVLGESGALKAMLLDQAERHGLSLPPLTDADSPLLRAALPSFVPVSNPLDMTAQALVDPGIYGRAIEALVPDDRVGIILIPLIQTVTATSHIKFVAVLEALQRLDPAKTVVICGVDEGGEVLAQDITDLRAAGYAYLPTTERALRALAVLSHHGAQLATDTEEAKPLVGMPVSGATVPEHISKALLGARGIPFPQGELARTEAEAVLAAERLGYPVVLKAQSPHLPHKSDAGGVVLKLANAAQVEQAFQAMLARLAEARPGMMLDGILVEPMSAAGTELIVGARNDPAWGTTILIGSGGVAAELLHDVRLLPADLSVEGIAAELRQLRLAPLLDGHRGSPAGDVDAAAHIVHRLARIVAATPEIREVDLNPVVVYPTGKGAVALDALISL
jgi:acyl-CoA synthetase (NDP forming)